MTNYRRVIQLGFDVRDTVIFSREETDAIRDADLVIDSTGLIIKDRFDVAGRYATTDELERAEQVARP